jgi:hypothetical protein
MPLAAMRADRYAASVTVPVEAPSPDAGPAVVRQGVESFVALADADQVLQPVAEAGGLSVDQLRERLDVEAQGTSNLVEITFEGSSSEQATQVPQSVADGALALFRSASLELATQDVAAFTEAYDEAVASLRQFASESGSVLPDDAYRRAVADDAAAEGVAAARDRLLEYQLRQAAVDRASGQLASAQAREISLRVRAQPDSESEDTLLSATPQRVDETAFLVQVAAGAILVGLLLAAGILVLTESLGRRRKVQAVPGVRTSIAGEDLTARGDAAKERHDRVGVGSSIRQPTEAGR